MSDLYRTYNVEKTITQTCEICLSSDYEMALDKTDTGFKHEECNYGDD